MTATKRKAKPANGLGDIDLNHTEPLIRKEVKKNVKRKRVDKLPPTSRKNRELNAAKYKLPPAKPKNKSLAEIVAMDADDPAFKQPGGRPRVERDPNDPKDAIASDAQKRANARRARARKGEAEISRAVEVLQDRGDAASKGQRRRGIDDEDLVIAEGLLNLDDWDNEELIRGYRRSRDGSFGKPPKFVSRELVQQCFRALVSRGDGTMKKAYIRAVEELVELAHNGRSEKVRLDAIRELMERVVGKVPDRVHVATEEPWEAMLADSFVPVSEAPPLELSTGADGVARMDPIVVDDVEPDPQPSGA